MPESARGVFGARLQLATAYVELLATDGVTRGLIGPREAPRLWERHLLNCAVLADVLPGGADVCDIGSGAGLPGLVLAIRRPDLQVTLLEPLLRRTSFLDKVVGRLQLDNVHVRRARAEDVHGETDFAVVTSRALAPLPRLLAWSMPLVRQGGRLMAMKGASAPAEVAAAQHDLSRWGAGAVDVLFLGADVIDPPTTVIRVEATRSATLRWNSSSGVRPFTGPGGRRRGKGRSRDPDGSTRS